MIYINCFVSAVGQRSSANSGEDDCAEQAKRPVVVAQRRAAGDGVRRVDRLVQRAAAQNLNEPNRTIKLHNAGMQFVALHAVEAALHVIQNDESVGATTMLLAPGRCHGRAARHPGHVDAQT